MSRQHHAAGAALVDRPDEALAEIQQNAAPQREVYTFTLPENLRVTTGFSKIGLVELTADEELQAAARSGNSPVRLLWELVKQSVAYVDGKRVHTGDMSTDAFWNSKKKNMPKVRSLITTAYNRIHNAAPEDADAFLESLSISVG